jgi:hypothetical protein
MLAHCISFAPSYVNNWVSMFVLFFSFVCLSTITLCLVVFLVFSLFAWLLLHLILFMCASFYLCHFNFYNLSSTIILYCLVFLFLKNDFVVCLCRFHGSSYWSCFDALHNIFGRNVTWHFTWHKSFNFQHYDESKLWLISLVNISHHCDLYNLNHTF